MSDLLIINIKTPLAKAAVIAIGLVLAAAVFYAVRWQVGNMLGELTGFDDPNAVMAAEYAVALAPSDPAGHELMGRVSYDPAASIESLRRSVLLAPNDHRRRIEYGRALEQNDNVAEAEAEFRKAVSLAPSYASPRWHYGNFLLRQEREADALAELKIAASDNAEYRDQVFSLLWEYFGKDPIKIEEVAGESPAAIARLTYFLAARGAADESLRNWDRLSQPDRTANSDLAKAVALGLFGQRYFRQALEFAKQYGIDDTTEANRITNPSFERAIDQAEETLFGWKITRGDPRLDVVQDSRVKKSGSRSLRLTFKGYNKTALSAVFQYIVVNPGKRNVLRFSLRTESLRSSGLPLIEIVDATNDRSLARSAAFPSGTNEWQEVAVEFVVPPTSNGIYIRTIREDCGVDCPITGSLWYDDFDLVQL
jgi:tetratricopeptide (TPR) repeat protein